MALKALMLRKKIDTGKKALEELRKKEAGFQTREAELETAIEEAETDEEKTTVEGEIEEFEAEKKEHEEEEGRLEAELERLEAELKEEEKRTSRLETQMKDQQKEQQTAVKNEREGTSVMSKRAKFYGLSIQERDVLFAREEVKNFISTVRTAIREKRGITNVGLVIPEVMLELLKTKVEETSKLLKYITVRSVTGQAHLRSHTFLSRFPLE